MPYSFWIPTDPDEWTSATIYEDGELAVSPDYNLKFDMALEGFGDKPSLVLRVLKKWDSDPILLLCGGVGLFPIKDTGLAAWSWARMAVDAQMDSHDFQHSPKRLDILDNALKVAFSALTKTRMPYKKLVVARRDVANLIADQLSYYRGQLTSTRTGDAMTAARQVLDGIIRLATDKQHIDEHDAINAFCQVAESASKAIRKGSRMTWEYTVHYETGPLIEAAVRTMGAVQEAQSGFRR